MSFRNVYDDAAMASAYARLAFPGTYHLAFRDLPALIGTHVRGRRALDFGCGAGRSSRFLRGLGFTVTGVDIAPEMLAQARAADPDGDYRQVPEESLAPLGAETFDLVLAAFPFDNLPTHERKVRALSEIAGRLAPEGRFLNVVSAPDIYTHEWLSFTTRDFPENAHARTGDVVRIINREIADPRPAEDIVWSDEAYREDYARASLRVVEAVRPLGRADEPFAWVNETRIAPWVIWVLAAATAPANGG